MAISQTHSEPPRLQDALSEAEKQRIWDHRQHLNEDLNNLANFFLLAQSFLLAAGVALDAHGASITTIAVIVVGLSLTVVAYLTLGKQRYLLTSLKSTCENLFPEYRLLRQERESSRWRLSNTFLLARVVPLIFGAAWIAVGIDMCLS